MDGQALPLSGDHFAIFAYLQVIVINLVLSGDNVIVIGMAAAGLASELRQKAIVAGIAAAAIIRIVLAVIAAELLAVPGILFFGGLLLFWVCWNMFIELRSATEEGDAADHAGEGHPATRPTKPLRQAIIQIIVADVSMSLDNVLAVAGAASQDMGALVFGLILSVLLMAVASSLVARLLARYRWIGWLGLAIIVYIAARMLFEGGEELVAVDYGALLRSWFG